MSCLHKRLKRTKSQEQLFQEQVRKVAKENGKRLGESLPPPQKCADVYTPNVYITWIWVDLNLDNINH